MDREESSEGGTRETEDYKQEKIIIDIFGVHVAKICS